MLSIPYETTGRSVTVRSEHVGDVTLSRSEATAFHGEQVMIVPITNAQLEHLVVLLPSGSEFTLADAVQALRDNGTFG